MAGRLIWVEERLGSIPSFPMSLEVYKKYMLYIFI